MASVLRPSQWSVSVVKQLNQNVCMSVLLVHVRWIRVGLRGKQSLKPYGTDPAITDDYSSNDSSLHHQILPQIFRPQGWPHVKIKKKSTYRAFYGVDIHTRGEKILSASAVPWPETIFDICLRVNHHLNMAYTVYHGASSVASLSLCFLPVPPPVSSLIVLIVNACSCCI